MRSPRWSHPPHFNFWTDGTDWVDAPDTIDNGEAWELELQAMSRLERLKVRLQCNHAWRHNPLKDGIIMEPSPRYEWFAYLQNKERTKRRCGPMAQDTLPAQEGTGNC
jgi:hypothetical protein